MPLKPQRRTCSTDPQVYLPDLRSFAPMDMREAPPRNEYEKIYK
jgi:hypothetical protein